MKECISESNARKPYSHGDFRSVAEDGTVDDDRSAEYYKSKCPEAHPARGHP